jgi:VWFA-related protein
MKEKTCRTQVAQVLGLWFCAVMVSSNAHGGLQSAPLKEPNGQQSTITVPARAGTPLYKGMQGAQRSEVVFSPSSRTVTIKCRVQDPNGYFVPNIRRENFAVYEDGVRQTNADVEIEHAPVSVAVLMEFGGRYHELNKALATSVHEALRHFIDVMGPHDKVALFKYGSTVETLADFTSDREALNKSFSQLDTPDSSEANFYDALIDTLHRVQAAGPGGRKAIIVISSGIDTFSKANYQQALQASRDAQIPIYTVGLGSLMMQEADVYGPEAPFSHFDWRGAEKNLENFANASGGRAYEPQSNVEFAAVFDDLTENLRVRYVITYVSSNPSNSGQPRKIRIELVDPQTGAPLKIRDSSGKTITAHVFVQETYSPSKA